MKDYKLKLRDLLSSYTEVRFVYYKVCLLWIDETKAKDKTYVWVSV